MKGMKKLFALLAVLTMALTMTPMVGVNAQTNDLNVTVTPASATIAKGTAIAFTASAMLSEVDITDVATFSWDIVNGRSNVEVQFNGNTATVTGSDYGVAQILVTAKYTAGGIEHFGTTVVTVTVQGLEISFEGLDNGGLTLYTTTPTDAKTVTANLIFYNGTGTTAVVPAVAAWSVDPAGLVTFSATNAQTTTITAGSTEGNGNVTFTATYSSGGIDFTASKSFPVQIKKHSISIEIIDKPANGLMLLNSVTTLTATVKFDGNTINTGTVTVGWESTATNVVRVGSSGLSVTATAVGVGSTNIVVTATYLWGTPTQTATAQVSFPIRVEEPTLDVRIEGAPEITIDAGTSTELIANVTINTGDTITYSWTNSNPNAVIVDSINNNKILIRGANVTQEDYSIITVTVKAGSLTKTATIKVIVTPAAAPSLSVSITGTTQLVVNGTALYTASVTAQNIPNFDSNQVTYVWESNNPNVAAVVSGVTAKNAVVKGISAGYATLKVTAKYGQYTAEAYLPIEVVTATVPPITNVVIANANGQWVTVGSDRLYQVSYEVYNAPVNAQGMVVRLMYGNAVLGESALNFRQVSARFESIWTALGGKDGVLKLVLLNSTASTTVPVKLFNLDSTFSDSYISGQPVGAVKGTIASQKSGFVFGTPNAAMKLGLVAQWEDADGNKHVSRIRTVTATISDDGKSAKFAIPENSFRFTVPAGSIYVVSENVYSNVAADGKYNGIPVAKFAYKTIAIKQGTLTANPNTIVLPPFTKEIYLYDQFGYALQNTTVKVDFGYKVSATADAPSIIATTDAYGKVVLRDIPKPVNYGTYTATISTLVGSRAVVDGVAKINVSFASQLVLSDNIIHPLSIHQLGEISIKVNSSGAPIKKLKIDVSDPNNVLADELDGFKLLAKAPFSYKWDFVSSTPCEEKLVDEYWFADPAQEEVTLTGTAVQGGTIMLTATAELADGSIAVASKEYVVKAYRIDSITPVSTEYNTSTTVKVVIKDWYGGLADGLNVKLVSDNPYGQVGQSQFTMIPNNFGSYVFNIPAGAVPGPYAVEINDVDYSEWSDAYFSVTPIPDLKLSAPTTVNAMSRFDVTVTDKSDNPVKGTWSIKKQVSGSVVNGKFTVDTAAFKDGSALGDYTITVITNDGKHSGSAVVSIVAPATITPTIVTNGFKSNVVVTMTSTAFNASLLDVAKKVYDPDKVVSEKVYSAQTATFTIKVLKSGMCTPVPKMTLKYGKFVLDDGVLAVGHPQLSFVNTATLYAGDVVPMQVKLVDATGKPLAGAVIKLSQLGYFEYTATTNAEGIADFGSVTLNAAGNIVAELISNADLDKVVDYRLIGQTDNTNYKVTTQILPARPAQDLKVTVTPTIVDAGKDALLTLNLVGADAKPVETGKSVVVTIGPTTYNGLVGANGVVTLTVKSESLTGTVVTGVVKVEGYNAATFTLAVKEAEKPEVKTLIELAPGMDVYSVNGETKFWDATPYIKEGRTLVPIRHLAEAGGFKASWDVSDPANKMVFIFKADQDPEKDKEHPFILLIIGQPTAMVNGNLVALDVAPEILNGRTMVPLRFVVETLGYQVEWLGNTIRLYK